LLLERMRLGTRRDAIAISAQPLLHVAAEIQQ
jgi:hypothetical protein